MKAYHSQRLLEERSAEQLARDMPKREIVAPQIGKPAAKSPRRALPICVECESHSWAFEWITGRITHRCHELMLRDPVTGAPTDPLINRRNAIACGSHAQYWRPREARAAPAREIMVLPDTEPQIYAPPVPVRLLAAPPTDDEVVAVLFERAAE